MKDHKMSPSTDGRTDGRTDRETDRQAEGSGGSSENYFAKAPETR